MSEPVKPPSAAIIDLFAALKSALAGAGDRCPQCTAAGKPLCKYCIERQAKKTKGKAK